ncbi:hypothetical protein ACKVWC_003444 [Pyricularia oryzae]
MRCAIVFLSIFAANALALPVNLCLGADFQPHLCKREDSSESMLDRREPANM